MLAQLTRILVTLAVLALGILCGWYLWDYYMNTPWTRDARVRADIIQIAPDVAGMVAEVKVVDNQEVRQGDLLFSIDKERYQLALNEANATLASHKAQLAQAQRDLARISKLSTVSISVAQQEQYRSAVDVAAAEVQAAEAALNTAKLNLTRTEVHAPADGFVTNLILRRGNYLNAGTAALALIDRQSFYVAGYFEETKLPRISVGDTARVMLMGVKQSIAGKVTGIASGIVDHERSTSPNLLANVNPTFTWVRLAQRIPVRIDFDSVPDGVKLVAGQTATVIVEETSKK